MKNLLVVFGLVFVLFAISPDQISARSSFFFNRIEGQIFDENRVPLGDMYVELRGDSGASFKTIKSTSSGRFTFMNLGPGGYSVRVLASGKNFFEQSKDLQFVPSMSGRSDETQFLDFYMRADKRYSQPPPSGTPEAIFYQDIPENAKKLYRSGIENLDKKQDQGLTDLENAILASPTYFDALSRLGMEYAIRKNYEKAYPYLMRAIDVNARSYSTYYFLAHSFYQLKQITAALKAAEACTILKADAADGHVLFGTVLRIHGDFTDAEKELKKANDITKGQNAEAHRQMALLYNRLNRNKEAANELELYLKIAPAEAAEKKDIQDLIAKLRAAKQGE